MAVDDYARACGIPKDVTIGGRMFRVRKVSPYILGELQRWMMTVVPNPRAEAIARINADPDMPDDDARRLWVGAALNDAPWPPGVSDGPGAALLASIEGTARLLHATARPSDSSLTLDLCRGAAEVMSDADRAAFWAAINSGEVGDIITPDSGGSVPSYTEIRATLCERYGWTLEYVDHLSFESIVSAWTAGKGGDGVSVSDASDAEHVSANWRSYVRGLA